MKVLHIIDHLGIGGARTIVETLIKKGPKNYYLYSLRKSVNEPIFTEEQQQRVKIYNKTKSKFNLSVLFDLKKHIKDNNIDIIHLHLQKSIFIGYLLKKLFKLNVKVIVHEHGSIFRNHYLYNKLLKKIEPYIFKFIAVSKATKKQLIENANLDEQKIVILYNFIDLDKFKIDKTFDTMKEKQKLGIQENEFVIGFVGRLTKVKSIDTIIKAINKLDCNFKFLIVGDGEEKKYLKKLVIEFNLENRVLFLGYRNDILNLYQLFDICILASKSEASPMVFYETQAMGIPLIGSNVYAINEFIKNNYNGLLFEFGDYHSLKKQIMKLRNEKKTKANISKIGTQNIIKYDLIIFISNLNEIYDEK